MRGMTIQVQEALALAGALLENPTQFRLLGYGDRKGGAVYLAPDGRALKIYETHPNKEEPHQRAVQEAVVLGKLADLAGTPNGFLLVKKHGKDVMIREAGFVPDRWTVQHFLQVQATLQAMAERRILLCDHAQVALRANGEAFLYDFDVAREARPNTGDKEIQEFANDSLTGWLREIGYPERDLRVCLETENVSLRERATRLSEKQNPLADFTKSLLDKNLEDLRLEDACRSLITEEFYPDVEMGYLFPVATWIETATDLEQKLAVAQMRLGDVRAAYEPTEQPAAIAFWQRRVHTLADQFRNAQAWVKRLTEGDGITGFMVSASEVLAEI